MASVPKDTAKPSHELRTRKYGLASRAIQARSRIALGGDDPPRYLFSCTIGRDLASTAGASAVFGVVALLLASIGLYGLISHNITSHTPKIGIRMALGARRWQVIGLILRETSHMILAGVVLGLAGAYGASRFAAGFLFGVEPNDPATIAAAVGLLIATAAAAAFLPARRASRVEPMTALRHE